MPDEQPPSLEEVEASRKILKKIHEEEKARKRGMLEETRDERVKSMEESKSAIEPLVSRKAFQSELQKGRLTKPGILPEDKGKSIEGVVAMKAFQSERQRKRQARPGEIPEDKKKVVGEHVERVLKERAKDHQST
ncbi:MAG: hypothetical protein ACTSU5_01335 [Promethearchaeota archaeon]